jgi:hypothetical protein
VFINTQGFGESVLNIYSTQNADNIKPDGIIESEKPRFNADNNGHLFINTSPDTLYNFNIDEAFLKNGIFEFELLYDLGNIIRNENTLNQFLYVPQTIVFNNDKDDFEQFMISIIIMDVEEDDNLYNDRELINKINHLIYRK